MHIHPVEAHARTLRNDLRPRLAARPRHRRRYESEVARAVIGQDQEALLLVVARILDPVAAGFDEHGLGPRLVAAQVAALAGHLARAREDDVALALGQLHVELV